MFTICLQDPRIGAGAADVIWVSEHDRLRADNVIVTLTSPHAFSADALARARSEPLPAIVALPRPRVSIVLGGHSAHHRFEAIDIAAMANATVTMAGSGAGLMVTASRRTPPELLLAVEEAIVRGSGSLQNAFVWKGEGANPYLQMLANADAILVTGDSVNMVGETLATGAPVHVYEPSGGHRKISAYLERLISGGFVRRWRGNLEEWTYPTLDSTDDICAFIADRYLSTRVA